VAGRIRQEDIEEVRERTDLVKLVSQYLTLRKAGHDSMVGLCPFHPEKTPSFSISPAKQVFYCFGCGEGGDAVKFLERVETLTFPEAIERLAREAGITLRFEAESAADRRAASRRVALHRANAEAAEMYHHMLVDGREGAEAREYVAGRGITPEATAQFQVGYAPMYADFLLRRLSGRFSPELLVEAGLATKDGGGTVRDRFRGRIVFPIHDLSGQAVGFGARLLREAEGQPKYLNTAETPIYRKGKLLYNLHRCKGSITRGGEVHVVEGYTDVIALSLAGVQAAVATCGTALGEEHYQLLSRFAQRVVLAFDSDEAGARAAMRAHGFHEAFPLATRVLVLPGGLDPADFVEQHGADAFRRAAAAAVPLVEYMIDRALAGRDLDTIEGRADAVGAALPILAGIADEIRRTEYVHLLADRAGVSATSVLAELQRRAPAAPHGRGSRSGAGGNGKGERPGAPPAKPTPQQRVEWDALKLMARSDEVLAALASRLSDEHFERAQHRKLWRLLAEHGPDVRSLVAATEDDKLRTALAALATEPVDLEPSTENGERLWARLEEFRLKRRIDDVRRRLQKLNPIRDAEYEPLFGELARLTGAWRRVRELV
jgi:DNA primase